MLKKTAFVLCTVLLSCQSWAKMLVQLDLASSTELKRQSIVIEDQVPASCQLGDLFFEVTATKQDDHANIALKIFEATRSEKSLVAAPEFVAELNTPASLSLEKNGQEMQLIIVVVDIV